MNYGSFLKDAPPDLDHASTALIWFGWASATFLGLVVIYLYRDCQMLHMLLRYETIRLNLLSRSLGMLRSV